LGIGDSGMDKVTSLRLHSILNIPNPYNPNNPYNFVNHSAIRFNSKYDKQPGRGIEDIIFRNIIYNGVGENPSLLKGFDKERSVKNIIFDNVIINGMKMKNIDDFITNEYIKNITVK
jgi:hypothetical protein